MFGEITEPAGKYAYIRGIDVAVDHEEDLIAVAPALYPIGHASHAEEIRGAHQDEAVVERKSLASFHFLPDGNQPRVGQSHL